MAEADEPNTAFGYPPYPPYNMEPAPPSVADTIIAGRDLRIQHKSTPKKTVRLPPRPAKAKGPKVTDMKMSRRAARAHARCLRRHGAVLTDRLERMSKPLRRSIIYMWREYAHRLPAETIARLRAMLDADEPFKPDQAYEYFINLRKTKNKANAARDVHRIKNALALNADKRIVWARNATVAFARGIQQRLSRPGRYDLAERMLRLSNIVLEDICGNMHMRVPSRYCTNPKAKFMMEMADKVAVWIDEILEEGDDRMLMMDFDEDNDMMGAAEAGDTTFADNFLNMMGDSGLLKSPILAYLKFTGEMLEAFTILTESMYKKADEPLLNYGKCKQTYTEAANELKEASDFKATEFNTAIANKLKDDLTTVSKSDTPNNLVAFMKDMIDICSNYLAQYAEFNKDKGPAFKLLVKAMHAKGNEQLYQKEKAKRTYTKAAVELENAKGLESEYDDPNLSQEIHSKLSKLINNQTPPDLKLEMKDTLDTCSKYLSQKSIDEIERGPAFDLLIKEMESRGSQPFTPQFPCLDTNFTAAYVLKSAPGFSGVVPDESKVQVFANPLHRVVDVVTPKALVKDMNDVIGRCSKYLSAFVRDRDKALQNLLKMMKSQPNVELVKRNNYAMNYGTGATEIETAPVVLPYLPVKDIAEDIKGKLNKDMEKNITPDMRIPTKVIIQDASKYLSQPVALRSGAAGERYQINFLAAIKKSLGSRPLFKYKAFGQTYADAAEVLKYSGPLEPDPKCENLQHEISSEMKKGVPARLAPTIAANLSDTMDDASKLLAKVGTEKGEALQHLVNIMKEEGEVPLGQLQGYQQSYNDGARRIENSPTLTNEKVDKGAYETIREKLMNLTEKKPAPTFATQMPAIVDESSKFLAAPFPENEAEKRRVLADLMSRRENEILGGEGLYKMTYTEGGEEIMNAPVGVTKAEDENTRKKLLEKVNAVIPEKKLENVLKQPAAEGAAYISDIIKGRGEVMQVLHDEMKKEKDKDFFTVGKFSKTHEQAAQMLETATHFGAKHPSPVLVDKVADKLKDISTSDVSKKAESFIKDTTDIASKYIAGKATDECGLDAKALAALNKDEVAKIGKSSLRKTSVETDDVAKQTILTKSKMTLQDLQPSTATSGKTGTAYNKNEDEFAKQNKRTQIITSDSNVDAGDPQRSRAIDILHTQLRARGAEVLYKQPHTELTYSGASQWLTTKPDIKVDKSVKESGDTDRLHKKFERKLHQVVSTSTPLDMYDTMQDVIIESSRILSEYFVSKSFKVLVGIALISEMQKRGNELLIEIDGATETFFFAAQRLKKTSSLEVNEPCSKVSYQLIKKLEDITKCRSMPRKIIPSMKDHIEEVANYLSAHVTKPDEQIEAYVTLLNEMEAAGDNLLVEGDTPKSYIEAATYLRQLTSFQDPISLGKGSLQSVIEGKLKHIVANVNNKTGVNTSVMNGVITENTRLLVSYIMLLGLKTEALKILVKEMEAEDENVLLRHGNVRRTFADGANALRTKNSDQLNAPNADPVVVRKIQIKLHHLMLPRTPDKYLTLMDDVIDDATMYLAVHFLQPHVVQICKCMKNVFVQCELWCDEILRHIAKPPCTCSRHISSQILAEFRPGTSSQGFDMSLVQCPKMNKPFSKQGESPNRPCLSQKPNERCDTTTSYLLYTSEFKNKGIFQTDIDRQRMFNNNIKSPRQSEILNKEGNLVEIDRNIESRPDTDTSSLSHLSTGSATTESPKSTTELTFSQSHSAMHAAILTSASEEKTSPLVKERDPELPRRMTLSKRGYNTRAPITTTDQMADWHALMVSLTWNVQAWRTWIQQNMDRAIFYEIKGETDETWATFQRQISTDALQWRQYNNFSRQLTNRLALRYRDKNIVSPTRATLKTDSYMRCQQDMLDIIDIFQQWTQWLTVVVKETNLIPQDSTCQIDKKWKKFKEKVQEYVDDWKKYNTHLKVCWEQKHKILITDWLPELSKSGAVWVMSACGAVPSGAVAAGVCDGEIIWVARTTHRCNVLPAALHPSKHCCIVYSNSGIHHYTKYQVMCNADVSWVACRASDIKEGLSKGAQETRAVRISRDVFVGRVLYRGAHLVGAVLAPTYHCHVIIFGRPFAFNCYELLVLSH